MAIDLRVRHVSLHGHRIGYRMAGEGPVVLLIHGMLGSSRTWLSVMATLARDYEPRLPRMFRELTRRLGTRETRSPDILSIIMFQGDYIEKMIDLGQADADARADEIARIIES